MSSTGSNKIEDVFKARGTYRLTPLSGVSGGGAVVTATATGGIVTVSVTAAKILLDSSPFTFPLSPLATSVLPDGVSNFAVYINPSPCRNCIANWWYYWRSCYVGLPYW